MKKDILACDECSKVDTFDQLEIVEELDDEPAWFLDVDINDDDDLILTGMLCPECYDEQES